MKTRLVFLGNGGHAQVLTDIAVLNGLRIDRYVESYQEESFLRSASQKTHRLVNAVGSVKSDARRQAVYDRCKKKGFLFQTLIHPSAIVAKGVKLGEGVQLAAGVVVNPGSAIGNNTIINTGAIVEHDCRIGAHAHIAPGAVISGSVSVGDGAHVGTGSVVLQGVRIGKHSTVGAGAVVTRNVPGGCTVVGVPAKGIS